jgi:DNA invertase Pin-like site-specific DNA recombinase
MEYIAYLRTKANKSQPAQKAELQVQRDAVNELLAKSGGQLIATHKEIEVGQQRTERPELEKAIRHARDTGAVLLIAKLGRLVRKAGFMGRLAREVQDAAGSFRFLCCDNLTANEATVHVLAAVAQEEAQRTAQRTKDKVAALKAQGVKFGSARPGHWKGREHKRGWKKAVAAASEARIEKARREYQWLVPEIKERRERNETMDEICQAFNAQGYLTSAGKPFTQATLWRLIKRYLGDEYLGNSKRKGEYREVTAESKQEVLAKVIPRIKELREGGATFEDIANKLNEEGYRTARGSNFSQSAIWNLVNKYLGQDYLGRVAG